MFVAIFAWALLFGYNGFASDLLPKPTPVPTVAATATPIASASPVESPSAEASPAATEAASPAASAGAPRRVACRFRRGLPRREPVRCGVAQPGSELTPGL